MKLSQFVTAPVGAAFQPGAEYVYHDVETGDTAAGIQTVAGEEGR